jgi:arabinogalactan oligomer/maltooligosaccharide transport system substrate-binding protein
MIADFMAAHPNIDVQVADEPFDAAHDKFLVAANAGEGADIYRAEIMWVSEFADLGLLREVTYFLTEADRVDFLPDALAPVEYDGDLWGLPQVTDCLAFLYNRSMYDTAGLEPPRTWEGLVAQAPSWEATHAGTKGFAFAMSDSYFFLPFLWSFGGAMLNPDTREPMIDEPEAVQSLEFVLGLQDQGVIPPDFDIANDYINRMEALKTGQVGAILNGPWATADLLQGPAFSDPENLGVAPVPHREGGSPRVSPIGGHALVIGADCEEPEAAYLLIHWLTSAAQQARFCRENNLLPTRRSAYTLPGVADNRIASTFGALLAETARPRPVLPQSGNLFPPLNRGFQEAIRREDTAVGELRMENSELRIAEGAIRLPRFSILNSQF